MKFEEVIPALRAGKKIRRTEWKEDVCISIDGKVDQLVRYNFGSVFNFNKSDFENDDYGLSDIVTLPLTFIQSLANASCSDLELPLPFVDEDVELPCMSAIYEDYFGPFLTIYQIITFGIVGYWVCVNTLRLVNNFKNPDNDEVEVMDL